MPMGRIVRMIMGVVVGVRMTVRIRSRAMVVHSLRIAQFARNAKDTPVGFTLVLRS
jgi:hypothetical protein